MGHLGRPCPGPDGWEPISAVRRHDVFAESDYRRELGGKEHSHETDQASQDGLGSHILDDRYPSGGRSRDMAILDFDP